MIGHKGLLKLDPNYYKTDPQELAYTYVNAVPNLTISESERLRLAGRRNDAASCGSRFAHTGQPGASLLQNDWI